MFSRLCLHSSLARVGGRRALASTSVLLAPRSAAFQPFSQRDEDDLVRVIQTRPRHVLKHVRQQVWRSRKRELHFRNTVTHLMITLQEFLRKQLLDPESASKIMEGVLEECVKYSQHDMAHLLFRAFLRFRKYGCTISVDALRFLFESYKENDSSDLMFQLANEMKGDPALRSLCVAAYLFSNHPSEAEELLAGLDSSNLTKDDLIAFVDGYDKLSKMDKIRVIVDDLKDGKYDAVADVTQLYEALLRVYRKRDDDDAFTRVLQIVQDKNISLSHDGFASILRHKMRHATSSEDIAGIEQELCEIGYVPDVTGNSIIISAYARLTNLGDRGSEELMLAKVDTLLSSIESRLKQGDPEMDISGAHLRAVIRGYGAAGQPERIKAAWSRMQHKGISDDVRVYNELMKWYAIMGDVKDVVELRATMEKEGVFPDAQTYTWVLRALGKYYPRHVEKLYDEIRERRVRPDVHLYTALIGTLGDLGQVDRVEELYEEVLRREEAGTLQITPIVYAVLIRVFSGNLDRAEALYEAAKQRNLSDHPHVQTSILHVYASNRSETGEKKLQAFLERMPGTWTVDTYNVLINMYGKQGNQGKVEELVEKMKKEGVEFNDVTFGTLVTAYGRWGNTEKVHECISTLKSRESDVSAVFYSVLASSMNRLGDTQGVTDAWDDLLASKLFPDTEVYNQFLTLYSRQHNMTKMQGVLDSMMKHVPPNPVTATTVLDMLGKSGRVAEMESLFEDMKTSPDTLPTSVTYHQMMNTYAKTGDVVKMERCRDEFLSHGHSLNAVTYNILADGYGRAKRFEQMAELVNDRKAANIPMDDLGYCILVSAYGRARMSDDVDRLFESVTAPDADASALTKKVAWSFIDAYCRCGNADKVEQCVALLAKQNPGETLTAHDEMALIPYYARMGQVETIEGIAQRIEGAGQQLNYSALNAIAKGYARVGRFDKTVETLHKMRDRNLVPDAATALSLSSSFLKAGLHEQAQQIVQWRRQYSKYVGDESGTEKDAITE